jgi:hypothetical protein
MDGIQDLVLHLVASSPGGRDTLELCHEPVEVIASKHARQTDNVFKEDGTGAKLSDESYELLKKLVARMVRPPLPLDRETLAGRSAGYEIGALSAIAD